MSLCEIALPFIIHKLVDTKNNLLTKCISKNVRKVFETIFKYTIDRNGNQIISIDSIQIMIKIIEFIRIEYIHKNKLVIKKP